MERWEMSCRLLCPNLSSTCKIQLETLPTFPNSAQSMMTMWAAILNVASVVQLGNPLEQSRVPLPLPASPPFFSKQPNRIERISAF